MHLRGLLFLSDFGATLSNFYSSLTFHCASVQVQVLSGAPNQYNPNQIFLIGDGFGLFVFFEKFEDTHFRNGVVKRPESKPRGPRKPKLAKDKEDNYENHQKL